MPMLEITLNRSAHSRVARRTSPGFTLVELLMAVAIFMLLIGGIVMLFVGSLRAVRQGYMTNEAHEMSRGAIGAIERDIMVGFTSRDRGDFFDFYGGPLGMCFTGLQRNNNDGSPKIARISYVMVPIELVNPGQDPIVTVNNPFYNPGEPALDPYRDPSTGESTSEINIAHYALIRYVEQGKGDLLDILREWMDEPLVPGGAVTLAAYLEKEVEKVRDGRPLNGYDFNGSPLARNIPGVATACCPEGEYPDDTERERCGKEAFDRCESDIRTGVLCETWLRMLSGGDDILPSAWEDRFMNRGLMPADARWRTPKDFTLLDHIAIPATRTKSSDPLPDNEADGDLYDFNDPRLADPLVRAVGHEYYRPDAPYFQPLYRTWRAEAICASGFSGQDNAWPQYNQMQYLFSYGRVETGIVADAAGNKNTVSATRFFKYWNGPGQLHSITRARNLGKNYDVENSVACAEGPDDSGHPLPQVVSLGFNLLFPSPFPGVPSLFKRFSRDIQVPSGSQYQGARP